MIDPFIKWAGGKRQLVDVIRPIVVERCRSGVYHEPFLGGGAIALSLDSVVNAGDACEELMTTWLAVREAPNVVSSILETYRLNHSPQLYAQVRAKEWVSLYSEAVAARFIYLNKMGFNGLYRVNRGGQFNVPLGRGRPSSIPTLDQLRRVSRTIRTWVIGASDFETVVDAAGDGDVIYADPPYAGTFDYASGFSEGDRRRLSASLRRAVRRGATAIVTDAWRARDTYRWMELTPIDERRRVAANGDRRSASCLLGVR